MTLKKIAGVAAAMALAGTALLLIPNGARSEKQPEQVASTTPHITEAQETWLAALRWCESRGNDRAINKRDRDGTPSYGRYQFNPSTLDAFAKKYGIATTTVMDASVQQKVMEAMVLDKQVTAHEWEYQQFPDCIQNKIGLPPK